jgi:AraC-like DNA-binding protein/quercetin dioxygenase-like cupin family protein
MNIAKPPTKPSNRSPTSISLPVSFGARPGGRSVQILASRYRRGTRLDLHAHREAQLVFAAEGLMQVETPKGRWLVPPDRAVWVPARLAHAIDVLADIEMRSIYFQPRWLAARHASGQLKSEFVVRVHPLLRELVLALFEAGSDSERVMRLAEVVIGELGRAGDATTFLPLPSDPKAREVAELLLQHPADDRDLDALARVVGVSGRTLSRLFPLETRLTFKVWRQRARIIGAIEMLGRPGQSIKRVATRLGFSSTAAFSFAFRQVTGQTPTEFLSRGAAR